MAWPNTLLFLALSIVCQDYVTIAITCHQNEVGSESFTTDCCNLDLESVPNDINTSTTHLILSGNKIKKLKDGIFAPFKKLKHLDLSHNQLDKLSVDAFKGMSELQTLNISFNKLNMTYSLPEGVFKPLSWSLLELDMRHNSRQLDYADQALQDLRALNILQLDCITSVSLGDGFSRLENLTHLIFAKGPFNCYELPRDVFNSLRNSSLRHLDLSSTGLNRIFGTWALPHLEELILRNNPHIHQAGYRIFNVNTIPKIKHIDLTNTTMDNFLFQKLHRYLTNSRITSLIVDQNLIKEVNYEMRESFPLLEKLSMAYNELLTTMELTAQLLELKHMRYINLGKQNNIMGNPQVRKANLYKRSSGDIVRLCYTKPHFTCPIEFPKNLTHLDLSFAAFPLATIPSLVLMNNNSLKFVDLSNNAIRVLPKPFYCAPKVKPSFEILDLSHNKIKCINSSYFGRCDWSSLKVLNLKQNQLRQDNVNMCDTNETYFLDFLKPLNEIHILDLAGNKQLSDLQSNTFINQTELKELHLSQMDISNFTFKISHMTKLQKLDISSNKLKCLNGQAMKELTKLSSSSKQNVNLTVTLLNNPLECSCECYDFLKWFQTTAVQFERRESLTCKLKGRSYHLTDSEMVFAILEEICFPLSWLRTMLILEMALWIFITVCSLLRRHKYRIYFLYLQLRIRLVSKLITEEIRPFHAFISYAEQDREWVKRRLIKNLETKRKLKLLVASRDFEAGKLISANIHSAITTSNKTVFVISKSFLKSSWCLEEFSMALTECRKRREFIMICILSPKMTMEEIQYPEMRQVLNNVTYQKWPPKLSASNAFKDFWDKMYTDVLANCGMYPNVQVIGPNGNSPDLIV